MSQARIAASFRDPSGFVFIRDACLYRQVNQRYKGDYDRLMSSGLYQRLAGEGLLVPHEEADISQAATPDAYKVLKPQRVPFISYPYERCFSQLKDAALVTLAIEKKAMEAGITLKDASAYNIQFIGGKPTLIDTLSFEEYRRGEPWIAYGQFCRHFLAPLALMSHTDVRLSQLLRANIDGIPVDLARKLLPWKTRFKLGLYLHIHVHGKRQERAVDQSAQEAPQAKGTVSKMQQLGIIDNLEGTIRGLSWRPGGTEWADYYDDTNYTDDAMRHKERLTAEYLDALAPKTVWDLGANTGRFSRIAAARGAATVAMDVDPAAVEKNYLACAGREPNVLPLLMDLTNPSPSLGWQCAERESLSQRGPADAVLALALVHHLAIGNNVPFESVAEFFASLGKALIVEFIPKSDSQVRRLLAVREDIFDRYNKVEFERAFEKFFTVERSQAISESQRVLYMMKRR